MNCPSYLLPISTEGTPVISTTSRYTRKRQEIFFRGIKERVFISANLSVIWRRVVFLTHERFSFAQPLVGVTQDGHPPYWRRNIRTFDPTNGEVGDILWQGQSGVDYSEEDRAISRIDPERVRVLSDRKVSIHPNYNMPADEFVSGKNRLFTRWHPINRKIRYDSDEDGSGKLGETGWESKSPRNPGNVYIMDMFYNGAEYDPTEVTAGHLKIQSTVYWHEQ
jgi:hypothetical protein